MVSQSALPEVREIPSGSVWRDLVSDFGSVDAGRVPDTFRHLFRSEVEGRGEPVLESFPCFGALDGQ